MQLTPRTGCFCNNVTPVCGFRARWPISAGGLVLICKGSLAPKLSLFFPPPSDSVAAELPGGVTGHKMRDVALGRPLISREWVWSQEQMRSWDGLRKTLAKNEI